MCGAQYLHFALDSTLLSSQTDKANSPQRRLSSRYSFDLTPDTLLTTIYSFSSSKPHIHTSRSSHLNLHFKNPCNQRNVNAKSPSKQYSKRVYRHKTRRPATRYTKPAVPIHRLGFGATTHFIFSKVAGTRIQGAPSLTPTSNIYLQHTNRGDGNDIDPRTPLFTPRQITRPSKPHRKPAPLIINQRNPDTAQPASLKCSTPQIRDRGCRRNQQLQRIMEQRRYGGYMAQGR